MTAMREPPGGVIDPEGYEEDPEVPEMLPKPRRGRAHKAAAEGPPIHDETYPGPVGEPPAHTPEELVAIETALEIFSDDMSPQERARLTDAIEKLQDEKKPRGRVAQPNLVEKLVMVMAAIDAVEKKGTNEAQKYSYQRATDVTKEVRREFIKHGLVLVTDVQTVDTLPIPRDRGAPNMLVTITGSFRITDGVDTISFNGAGMGQDVGDKGIYKAITGMLKYGLRTLLLLPDEKDDPEVPRPDEYPDANNAITITSASVPGVRQGGRQANATSAQIKSIRDSAAALMLSPDSLSALIVSELGSGPKLDPGDPMGEQKKQVMDYLETLSFDDCGKVAKVLVETVDGS